MVKKIKVVEIDNIETPETVETPEAVESPSSKMKLLSPTDESPETVQTPEPIADEPPIKEELKIDEVEPSQEIKTKKQDEKITCSICNKTMLMKTYKYTHQKLCISKNPEPTKVIEPPKVIEDKPKAKKQIKPKEKESTPSGGRPNLGQVSFTEYKEMQKIIPDPIDIYRAAKEQRQQVRMQRVKSLILQAV
jgi:hypothetical protein